MFYSLNFKNIKTAIFEKYLKIYIFRGGRDGRVVSIAYRHSKGQGLKSQHNQQTKVI